MPQRYKVISGEHETFVTEDSVLAAATLAIKMFDLKNSECSQKLGPFIMVVPNDGEYEILDTQFILNNLGLKYDRIIHEGEENEQNSSPQNTKPQRRNFGVCSKAQE